MNVFCNKVRLKTFITCYNFYTCKGAFILPAKCIVFIKNFNYTLLISNIFNKIK